MSSSAGTRARRRVRTTVGQRLRTVAPPVGAALLLGIAVALPDSDADVRRPEQVTVERSAYACPAGDGIAMAAGQVASGASATARTLPDREVVDSLGDPSVWRRDSVDADAVVMDQRGSGSGAVGFFSQDTRRADGGGLVVGPCPPTIEDSWYLGAGSGGKHLTTLVLTNLSSAPVVADLSFWGTEGRIDAVDAEGVVVDPYTVRRVDLRDLAAGEAELAVRVERRRGSLAVAALDSSTAVFRGTEAMEPTSAPHREQVVAGSPGGSSTRTLMLLNSTTSTARVGVEVVGAKGTFAPDGLESVKVGAGRFVEVPVPKSAGTDAAAIRLRSDQPVSAALRVSPTEKDHAVVEAQPVVDGPAVVPVDLGVGTDVPKLVLSALGRKGRVRLEAYDDQMKRLATGDVGIDADTTKTVDLGSSDVLDSRDAAYVVVRTRGTVTGAITYRRGSDIASLGLTAAPVTVLGPQVRPAS